MSHNPATGASLAPPSAEECAAAVLELERCTARLVAAGVLPRRFSARLVRNVARQHSKVEEARRALPKLILEVLLAVDDGTLKEGVHYRRHGGTLALHLESMAPALFRAQRTSLGAAEMRRLFRFGCQHFREVVVAVSIRVTFGPEEDRRRAVVLDVARANEFLGNRRRPVPLD